MLQFSIRGLLSHRVCIGREHAGGNESNVLPLLDRKRSQDRLCGGLSSFPNHVKDTAAVQIRDEGDVVVPSPETLVVEAEVRNAAGFESAQPPFDCTP